MIDIKSQPPIDPLQPRRRRRPGIATVAAVLTAITVLSAGYIVYEQSQADLLTAMGGSDSAADGPMQVAKAEGEVRRLRAKQQVLGRREEILRYQLKQLEEQQARGADQFSSRLAEEYRKSRNTLVLLLKDQQDTDQQVVEYLKQMWEAEGRARVATMGMETAELITLSWPVEPEFGISAGFHDSEYEDIFGMEHQAIDIPAEQGTAIHVAANGVVDVVADNGMGYSYVIVRHEGFATLYGHVSDITVEQGDHVFEGDTIALSGGAPGTKGAGAMTTGPHVHFELIVGGSRIDPISYLPYAPGVEMDVVQH